MKLTDLNKEQRSLLLYLEARAVDYGGRVATEKMNTADVEQALEWSRSGFIQWGRLVLNDANHQGTHWVVLSDEAFAITHEERRARAKRMWDERGFTTTEDKRKRTRT